MFLLVGFRCFPLISSSVSLVFLFLSFILCGSLVVPSWAILGVFFFVVLSCSFCVLDLVVLVPLFFPSGSVFLSVIMWFS